MLPKSPSFRLDGRRALVTGAGRGIGLAAAAALSEAGAGVTLCARTSSEIDAAAEAIRANGGTAEVLVLDVTDVTAASAAIGAAEPFDILVNNAGTNRPNHVSAVSVADFDFVMNLNVRASYFVAQAVSRRLIQAGVGGYIINISSQMGHVGAENRSLYCASKWAMEGFSKAMEDQLFKGQVMSKIKLGRLGQVEDLMGAIVYLASDASSLTTGSSMLIDGGWTAA
jgi:NAD(P)-dependent dehydrogenase (short-subunit alcohol dehydrogenase family)